jgi:hypothetical protein
MGKGLTSLCGPQLYCLAARRGSDSEPPPPVLTASAVATLHADLCVYTVGVGVASPMARLRSLASRELDMSTALDSVEETRTEVRGMMVMRMMRMMVDDGGGGAAAVVICADDARVTTTVLTLVIRGGRAGGAVGAAGERVRG